jgi:hypothetical protein
VEEIVLRLVETLENAADKCDGWAEESKKWGYSTHQVKDNQDLANELRRKAAKARSELRTQAILARRNM